VAMSPTREGMAVGGTVSKRLLLSHICCLNWVIIIIVNLGLLHLNFSSLLIGLPS